MKAFVVGHFYNLLTKEKNGQCAEFLVILENNMKNCYIFQNNLFTVNKFMRQGRHLFLKVSTATLCLFDKYHQGKVNVFSLTKK